MPWGVEAIYRLVDVRGQHNDVDENFSIGKWRRGHQHTQLVSGLRVALDAIELPLENSSKGTSDMLPPTMVHNK